MNMKDVRAFVTDLWVRLCTFLLLVLASEAEAFSKGEKEERDLKIGDSRSSCGFEVNEERERDEDGGRWHEKGQREIRKKNRKCRYRSRGTALGIRISKGRKSLEILIGASDTWHLTPGESTCDDSAWADRKNRMLETCQ